MTRSHVAGLGITSAYGWGVNAYWRGVTSSESAARMVTPSDGSEPILCAAIPDGGDPADGASTFSRAVMWAAREATNDAAARGWRPGRRVGFVLGTTIGEAQLRQDLYLKHKGHLRPREYLPMSPSTLPRNVMHALGLSGGPSTNVQAACASGNVALLTAQTWLDAGWADDVVVVAADVPDLAYDIRQFVRLKAAASPGDPLDLCRPFQDGSTGFVTGEGAVAWVLTRSRVDAHADLLGGAFTFDPFHVIGVNPDTAILADAYRQAFANAGVTADSIGWFNAHGAGTVQGDGAETVILDTVLTRARVFGMKPLAGHAHGGASGIEGAASVLAYGRGVVPAPRQVADGHPRLLNGPTPMDDALTVKASMGMGGYNAVVIYGPPMGDTIRIP